MTNALAGVPERPVVLLSQAMSLNWSADPEGWQAEDVDSALARLDDLSKPLKHFEPDVDGERATRLKHNLRMIGAKVSPTMAKDQIDVWLGAMAVALSDLPVRFAIRGAMDAMHTPIRYLNEVEGIVREKAESARVSHNLAVLRLQNLKRAIQSAKEPKLPPPEPRDITQDEVDAMTPSLRKIGLSKGWITQEQVDAVPSTPTVE